MTTEWNILAKAVSGRGAKAAWKKSGELLSVNGAWGGWNDNCKALIVFGDDPTPHPVCRKRRTPCFGGVLCERRIDRNPDHVLKLGTVRF